MRTFHFFHPLIPSVLLPLKRTSDNLRVFVPRQRLPVQMLHVTIDSHYAHPSRFPTTQPLHQTLGMTIRFDTRHYYSTSTLKTTRKLSPRADLHP